MATSEVDVLLHGYIAMLKVKTFFNKKNAKRIILICSRSESNMIFWQVCYESFFQS